MNKEPALAALRSIDVTVHNSGHKELSEADIGGLQAACQSLMDNVAGNSFAEKKAAWLVRMINSAFLTCPPVSGGIRQYILECGVALAIFIQRQKMPN